MTQDEFKALLEPLARTLGKVDLSDEGEARAQIEELIPFDSDTITTLRQAAQDAIDSDWLLPKEAGGIRFGRVVKDIEGFSVDAVLMSTPGPLHNHPNGEIDLCFATRDKPLFDGHPEGWVVYGPDSTHTPTVTDGEMLILYFLPEGAIRFL